MKSVKREKLSLVYIAILFAVSCSLPFGTWNEEGDWEEDTAEPPAAQESVVTPLPAASDKWSLWNDGTRLWGRKS